MILHRLILLVLVTVLPHQVLAQVARVISGEHPDFTRIVVQYPAAVSWQVGRTPDGYELRIPNEAARYDLTKAFNLISKDRLAAIWADPDTGALHFSVACACFAMPFEFRPDTIVIDIRNGSPPKESVFEQALDGGVATELVPPAAVRPQVRPATGPQTVYDWTDQALAPQTKRSVQPGSALGLASTDISETLVNLEPLRQSLIEQLSKGASAGIVDMAKPKPQDTAFAETGGNPSVEMHLGEAPNLKLRQKGEPSAPMTAEGLACIGDDKLDVAAWSVDPAVSNPDGNAHATEAPPPTEGEVAAEGAPEGVSGEPLAKEIPVSMQFALAMAELTGEFDHPDPEAIHRAIRFNLYIGFGAEARVLMRAFPGDEEDRAIWQSLAWIMDEEPDPDPAFAGMEACDTAAALWAVLADPDVSGIGQMQKAAILRAFSALPSHLRDHLGPTLVERFLAMKDFATATALRDAVVRGNPEPGAEVELMQAAIDKASGSPGSSVSRLEGLAAHSGPSTGEALVALIIQRAELGQDISFDQVLAMEQYAKEHEGSEDHEKYQTALTLAYAGSRDFDKAFANLAKGPDAAGTLWQMLANGGPDSAVLTYSTLEDGQDPPRAARPAATLIANRMLELGLGDQAARWLQEVDAPPKLLAARVAIAQGKAQEALDLVVDLDTPVATKVRLQALDLLGDKAGVIALLDTMGMTEDRWSEVTRSQDWQSLAEAGPEVWKAAAEKLVGTPPAGQSATVEGSAPEGQLARSKALVDGSVATRDAISALLDEVKSPEAATQ